MLLISANPPVVLVSMVGEAASAASPIDRLLESSRSLERVARGLIGAIERSAGFRQNRH